MKGGQRATFDAYQHRRGTQSPVKTLAELAARDGLPISLELLGRPWSEPVLLRVAAAYERLRGPRVTPKTTPHLPGEVFSY